ncbi:MAG TPA: hypothetical protein VKB96_02025 [Gammaproteobacteria bacterium]|nr:hypothetical protein [Gammaproteobacteria bacterium]
MTPKAEQPHVNMLAPAAAAIMSIPNPLPIPPLAYINRVIAQMSKAARA